MSPSISRTCHQLFVERPDPPSNQVRILKMPYPNCAIKALGNDVDHAVCIAGRDLKLRLKLRKVGKDLCEVR